MKKPNREELMEKVIELAKLPREDTGLTYLSRRQLESLVVYLQHITGKLEEAGQTLDNLLHRAKEFEKNHGQTEMEPSES